MNKPLYFLISFILIIALFYGTYNFYTVSEKTVVVGYLHSNHHSALFVANAKDMFKNEGIRVQLVPFKSGSEIVEAAEAGKIDIGYCGIAPVTMAVDNGASLKIIGVVNQEGSGVVIRKYSNITNTTDLKGKKIAIPQKGSVQDILLKKMLIKNNISHNEVDITTSEVPYMPESLLFKKFDAFVAWEPYVSVASLNDNETVLAYSEDIWQYHPCCVIIATDSFVKKESHNLRKFLKVHAKATDYINNNKEETALITSKKLGTNLKVEEEGLKHVKFVSVPTDDFITNVYMFIGYQKQLGYIKNNITKDQLFDFKYLPLI